MWRAASRSSLGLIAAVVLSGLGASCVATPRTLHWRIEFATSMLQGRTDRVAARVLVGGCDGSTAYDEASAKLARERSLAFFKTHMG